MKFGKFAAAAALVLGLTGPALAQTQEEDRYTSTTTFMTSTGEFKVCRDAGRFPVHCGDVGEPIDRVTQLQSAYLVHHVIKLPTGALVKSYLYNEVGMFHGITEMDGKVLMITMSYARRGRTGIISRYEPATGTFREIYSGGYYIHVPSEKTPGPYMPIDSGDGNSRFRGLLRVMPDDTVKVYLFQGDLSTTWVETIEVQADGRLKMTHAQSAHVVPTPVTFFNPQTGEFTQN